LKLSFQPLPPAHLVFLIFSLAPAHQQLRPGLPLPFSFLPAHQPPRHTKARNNPLLLSLTDALSPRVILSPPPSFPLHCIRRSKPPPSLNSRAPLRTFAAIPATWADLLPYPISPHPKPRQEAPATTKELRMARSHHACAHHGRGSRRPNHNHPFLTPAYKRPSQHMSQPLFPPHPALAATMPSSLENRSPQSTFLWKMVPTLLQ
jgi:hypothetical protein